MKHIVLSILVLLVASCTPTQALPESPTVPPPVPTDTPQANMPNPAAVYCEEQGYTYEIRTAADGSQSGACIFPDDSECDGWAFYRGECAPSGTPQAYLPNPASAYCEQQGYRVEIRTAADGSQSGACIFPDGSECDEWAFYHGECGPAGAAPQPTEVIPEGWSLYCHETLGFCFQYPADATLELDASGYTVYVTGPLVNDNAWPVFMISFPGDRQDYRLPEGADLRQWLVEHNLLIEEPQPDATIAGTIAIHTRFQGSPQAYADDRYFFAHEGQIYVIGIMHTGNLEDWELYNHFLESIQFVEPNAGL